MTALLAPRPGRNQLPRPQLWSVPRSRGQLATVPFVLVVALVLAAGLVGLLVLTTALQDQAFAVQSRQREAKVLAARVSALEARVAEARSVQGLAVAAQQLGMRPNASGAQLSLTGQVSGKASPVTGAEVPGVRYLTPEQAEAHVTALDRAEAERTAKAEAAAAKAKAEAAAKAKAAAAAKAKAAAAAKAKAEAAAKAKAKAKAPKKARP